MTEKYTVEAYWGVKSIKIEMSGNVQKVGDYASGSFGDIKIARIKVWSSGNTDQYIALCRNQNGFGYSLQEALKDLRNKLQDEFNILLDLIRCGSSEIKNEKLTCQKCKE